MKLSFRAHTGRGSSFSLMFLHGAVGCSDADERIRRLLDGSAPDFVLFGGDCAVSPQTEEELRRSLRTLTAGLRERGIPYAFLLGERDLGGLSETVQQRILEEESPCFTESGGETDADGDRCLTVWDGDEPCLHLWCMNSHGYIFDYERAFGSPTPARLPRPLYTEHYLDGVHFRQSLWYWRESVRKEEAYGRKIPGVLFCHIPVPEFVAAAMNANQTALTGKVGGAIRCQTVNGGLFTAAAERHDVSTIVCAHDGESAFEASYAGLKLVMTSGLGSPLGDGTLFTWERTEDGMQESRRFV